MLARWSRVDGADRYLRPFVARGPLTRGGAVVIGLNPATSIGPEDVDFEAYLDLLLDMERFSTFYQELRVRRGKPSTSRTRMGLAGVAGRLATIGFPSVVETNVSPYPTEKGEELKGLPLVLQARHVLPELLVVLKPRLMLLHGEDALKGVEAMMLDAELSHPRDRSFTDTVTHRPCIGQVTWDDGSACRVYVCPHLRFFGHKGGKRFAALDARLRADHQQGLLSAASLLLETPSAART